MPWTNFHSHTTYCDGIGAIEEYILEAIKQEMPSYGVSAHAPVNFEADWCIAANDFDFYLDEVRYLKQKYSKDIEVYLGLETDYFPKVSDMEIHAFEACCLDYVIGSIHFVDTFEDGDPWNIDHTKMMFLEGLQKIFKNKFLLAAERFYTLSMQMVIERKPDIIGHLDKIKMYNHNNDLFDEADKRYRAMVYRLLEVIKENNTIIEVNTRGYYKYNQRDLYPSGWIMEKVHQLDIPVMLNSDSHRPGEISSGFKYAASELRKIGIQKLWTRIDNRWKDFDYNEDGLLL
jgi:histidinol-phosphatase (PHP family)